MTYNLLAAKHEGEFAATGRKIMQLKAQRKIRENIRKIEQRVEEQIKKLRLFEKDLNNTDQIIQELEKYKRMKKAYDRLVKGIELE